MPISHPLWLRLTHWLNALAVIVMIMSGWRIYNASPLFIFTFPGGMTLGGWLGGALQWHFAAMWMLFANGLLYIAINAMTGRFRAKFFPLDAKTFLHELGLSLRFKLSHGDLGTYNMIQKILYLGVVLSLILIVMSGLVLWKHVQFPNLNILFGGYEGARIVHFICMAFICAFMVVHVALSLLVPKTLKGMIVGRF